MIRLAHLDRPITTLDPDDQQAWRTWLTRMGLDPDKMPVDQDLICDDVSYTITFDEFKTDEDGRLVFDDDQDPVRVKRVKQLEAPALPLPQGYWTWEIQP